MTAPAEPSRWYFLAGYALVFLVAAWWELHRAVSRLERIARALAQRANTNAGVGF